jgi:DNA-binding NtrC family response regulator
MPLVDNSAKDAVDVVHCVAKIRGTIATAQIRHAKRKLLVLNQDAQVCQAINNIAREFFQVIQSDSPQWAIAWLGQYPDVTVFLVDEELPQGSGSELLRRCQAMRPDVLRVLMSQSVSDPRILRARQRGIAQTLVQKPISRSSLLSGIMPQAIEQIDIPQPIVA